MIWGMTMPQFVGLVCLIAICLVTGGPWLIEWTAKRISRAHFREKEEHLKRTLRIAEGDE